MIANIIISIFFIIGVLTLITTIAIVVFDMYNILKNKKPLYKNNKQYKDAIKNIKKAYTNSTDNKQ